MNEPFSKESVCVNCKVKRKGILHRRVAANEGEHFVWVCSVCNRMGCFGGKLWIPHEDVIAYLTLQQIEDLPIVLPPMTNRCVRCGKRGGELHHWAPREAFGADEAEKWPQDCLCVQCHNLWRETLLKWAKDHANHHSTGDR